MKNAFTFYTNTTARIRAPRGGVQLVYKKSGSASIVISQMDGVFFSFSAPTEPGSFFYQISDNGGNIIEVGTFTVEQNLATAADNFDPRSEARKTLEALDAKIAGRALTIQQSKITVGDRSIEYMNSIDELLKWRDHFARIVAKEEGHGTPTNEVCRLRRV